MSEAPARRPSVVALPRVVTRGEALGRACFCAAVRQLADERGRTHVAHGGLTRWVLLIVWALWA